MLGIPGRQVRHGRGWLSRSGLRSRGNSQIFASNMARLRSKLSALVLWCAFLALYLGEAAMLVIGLILSSRAWWAAIQQHANLWAVAGKAAEVLILGAGLLLILIIPVFHNKSVGRSGAWRTGRRAETDGRLAVDKGGTLMTL